LRFRRIDSLIKTLDEEYKMTEKNKMSGLGGIEKHV